MRVARFLVAPALIIVAQHPLVAQTLGPGTRVRVTTISHDLEEEVGTIREVAGDGLSVHFARLASTVELDLGAIETLDVSVRRESRRKRGILIGAAIGATAGVVAGLAAGDDPPCTPSYTLADILLPVCDAVRQDAGEKAVFGAFVWGAVGTLVGLAIGSLVRRDIWTPVEGWSPEFALAPNVGDERLGVRVVLSLRLTR